MNNKQRRKFYELLKNKTIRDPYGFFLFSCETGFWCNRRSCRLCTVPYIENETNKKKA